MEFFRHYLLAAAANKKNNCGMSLKKLPFSGEKHDYLIFNEMKHQEATTNKEQSFDTTLTIQNGP